MKTILKYLIILAIVIGFSTGAVSATELVNHEFNGEFNALAPENVQFNEENGMWYHIYINEKNKISYIYLALEGVSEKDINEIYTLLESAGLEKVNNTGNLTIFKVEGEQIGQYGAGIFEDGKFVCVTGDNLDQLKEIAESVKFN